MCSSFCEIRELFPKQFMVLKMQMCWNVNFDHKYLLYKKKILYDVLAEIYLLSNLDQNATIWMSSYIDGLVQDCSNSNALAVELLQSCTKRWI